MNHFRVNPQYHWTDDKIRVHLFNCLTAVLITEVLRMKMNEAGIEITMHRMLDELSIIHDAWRIENGKKVSRMMEDLNDPRMATAKKIWAVVEALPARTLGPVRRNKM